MQKSRRNFIGYLSILGISSFTGFSLTSSPLQASPIPLKVNHFNNDAHRIHDDAFDPDGWL